MGFLGASSLQIIKFRKIGGWYPSSNKKEFSSLKSQKLCLVIVFTIIIVLIIYLIQNLLWNIYKLDTIFSFCYFLKSNLCSMPIS